MEADPTHVQSLRTIRLIDSNPTMTQVFLITVACLRERLEFGQTANEAICGPSLDHD